MKYTLIAGIVIISLIIFFNYSLFMGGDFQNHLQKARGDCSNLKDLAWSKEACESYAPLFHFLATPFSFHEKQMVLAGLILTAILTPLLLFFLTKSAWSTFFYFTSTNYFYYLSDGIYPQALTNTFMLGLFLTNDIRKQLLIVLLMSFSHSHGLFLGIIVLLIRNITPAMIHEAKEKLFLMCSGTFGLNTPPVLDTKLGTSGGNNFFLIDVGHFFVKVFPFPLLVLSFYQNLKDKSYEYILIAVIAFFASLFVSPRTDLIVPLVLIPGLTSYIQSAPRDHKRMIILFCLIVGVYQLVTFLSFKQCIVETIV